ncbi:hypothetical protein EW146_g6518 [Bondarzewia mesenterica]|uniref:Uncharacterized protein n=1 Tax=Bondarzewia mesenterica TaxID=1095465 RepID=A0A4S4LNB2_9AGAM|nr:hypothetical protein EW146_g6518 [Bondarzewia mesenterica]
MFIFELLAPCRFKWDTAQLVKAFWELEPNGIELVLGIKQSGASYLLLPLTRWPRLQKAYHLPFPSNRPYTVDSFVSLSPIRFESRESFTKKLAAHRPKQTKKDHDTSQANKLYSLDGDKQDGGKRAVFEQCRVIFQALHNNLDVSPYGLVRTAQWDSIKFMSLTYNIWDSNKSRLLDVGWTVFRPNVAPIEYSSSVHVSLSESAKLGRSRLKKAEFQHGQTETLSSEAVTARFEATLSGLRSHNTPVVILVYDEASTQKVLNNLGIATSGWTSGIDTLLRAGLYEYQKRTPSYRAGLDPRAYRHRSRSPRRGESSTRTSRARSPPPPSRPDGGSSTSGIYVVDVRALYNALKQMFSAKLALTSVANDLGITADKTSWCAGNESRLLVEMFCTMAAGTAIDEQRAARWGANANAAAETESSTGHAGPSTNDVDPNDLDPNDIEPAPSAVKQPAKRTIMDDWDATDSEDEGGRSHYTYR